MARATPYVLILAALFYMAWPWVGLVVLAVGTLVIISFWFTSDTRYYPRSPWQHPLYAEDFTRLRPSKVVFSRWSPVENLNELEVLIQENGDFLQVSVSDPPHFIEGSAHPVAEGEPSEIVIRLVSAVERESGAVE